MPYQGFRKGSKPGLTLPASRKSSRGRLEAGFVWEAILVVVENGIGFCEGDFEPSYVLGHFSGAPVDGVSNALL